MRPDRIELRFATEDDLEALQAVMLQTWHRLYERLERNDPSSPRYHPPPRLRDELDSPVWELLVAVRDGALVGTASGWHRVDGSYLLERIYVVPAAQGQGVGARLFERMVELARGKVLRVELDARNLRGLEFYRARGFEVASEFTRGSPQTGQLPFLALVRSPARGAAELDA